MAETPIARSFRAPITELSPLSDIVAARQANQLADRVDAYYRAAPTTASCTPRDHAAQLIFCALRAAGRRR
jgi:hypothetical protein